MKNILVTGAAGFIGSNLVHFLLKQNDIGAVLSYDLLTYAGHIENLEEPMSDSRHAFVQGDIGDSRLLQKTLDEFQPDAVLHLAAETHVDRSITSADPFIQTNVNGHVTLLKTVQEYVQNLPETRKSSFRFVHISTDEVFGDLQEDDPPFCEETPYDPSSPYSASKAAGDHLTRAWHRTYGLPAIIMNCSNNYGPYQFPEKLIPVIITRALAGEPLPVYGEGKNIRDWLYVEDHARAITMACRSGEIGQTYCIGADNEQRNIDLVKHICAVLDEMSPRTDGKKYEQQITFVTDRPGHDFRYAIDSSKARKELGWEPQITFGEGLRKTISWYLSNQRWAEKVLKRT